MTKLGGGLLRRAMPGAPPPAIGVELQRTQVAPGETLGGHVKVSESGRARRLTVALCCRDRTADYVGTSQQVGLQTLASGALTAPAELPFTIAVPPEAPPSYSAGAISIWWEVEARCDVFGSDVKARAQVEVTAR